MNRLSVLPLLALAMVAVANSALADSSDASCQVRKDGETKHGASGPCTFSQRQGYIDIDLRNGDTYSLRPTGKANHYKDQKDIKVVRTMAGGNTQEFKWEGGKKITVTFSNNYHGGSDNGPYYGSSGGTPPDLRYLVGSQYVGGEVNDEMMRHGYTQMRDSVHGNNVSSYWESRHGRCVVVHMNKSRHVTSIVSTSQSDCE
jgi:hypothetical protein